MQVFHEARDPTLNARTALATHPTPPERKSQLINPYHGSMYPSLQPTTAGAGLSSWGGSSASLQLSVAGYPPPREVAPQRVGLLHAPPSDGADQHGPTTNAQVTSTSGMVDGRGSSSVAAARTVPTALSAPDFPTAPPHVRPLSTRYHGVRGVRGSRYSVASRGVIYFIAYIVYCKYICIYIY